jgi:hypothetical protein
MRTTQKEDGEQELCLSLPAAARTRVHMYI